MVSNRTRFPFLARTGFQNRAPTEAKPSFFESKGFLRRGRPQELPKSSQDPSKSPPRGPKSCQRGSKDAPRAPKEDSRTLKKTPKTLQEHQKSYRLIVSYFHSIIIACSHGSASSRALLYSLLSTLFILVIIFGSHHVIVIVSKFHSFIVI